MAVRALKFEARGSVALNGSSDTTCRVGGWTSGEPRARDEGGSARKRRDATRASRDVGVVVRRADERRHHACERVNNTSTDLASSPARWRRFAKKIDDGRGGRERFRECQVITKSRFFIYVILMFQSGLV